jgi:hypothetical protein
MTTTGSGIGSSIPQLIGIPAVITLAVTILRLVGELQHWSKAFFNPEAGGAWSIVGITWLAPLFGIYLAVRLVAAGEGPASVWRALGWALLGVVVALGGVFLEQVLHRRFTFQQELIYIWINWALAAAATLPGWAALFRTLVAYGYAARFPVAVVMFFAFRGNWGTHYDALPPDFPSMGLSGMGFWPKYLWLGFFPQLIFWVGFTIVTGMLFGTIAAAIVRLVRRGPKTVS